MDAIDSILAEAYSSDSPHYLGDAFDCCEPHYSVNPPRYL